MKRLLLLLLVAMVSMSTYAQVPSRFNYQAVVRDASNGILTNQAIGVRVSIVYGSINGSEIFAETHTVTTSETGVLSLVIGDGTLESGSIDFVTIDGFEFFLKVEMDSTGGTNYTLSNTSKLLSVPYALKARQAENGVPNGFQEGEMLYWDGGRWLTIEPGQQGETLTMCGGIPRFGACTPIVLTNGVSAIGDTTATVSGIIQNDGGYPITQRGIVYSTSPDPTLADNVAVGPATENFDVNITGLTQNTLYYVRAYATNTEGASYGSQTTVLTTCSSEPDVPDTMFVGNYVISNVTSGLFGPVFGDGITVNIELGNNPGERKFSAVYLPGQAIGQNPMEFNFSLVCNEVNVSLDQSTNLQCTIGLSVGPDVTKGTYNIASDSFFSIILQDNVRSDCGSGPVVAQFNLTKI